jgi:hypothetical protein
MSEKEPSDKPLANVAKRLQDKVIEILQSHGITHPGVCIVVDVDTRDPDAAVVATSNLPAASASLLYNIALHDSNLQAMG